MDRFVPTSPSGRAITPGCRSRTISANVQIAASTADCGMCRELGMTFATILYPDGMR